MAKQDDYVRYTIRVPADLYERVKEAAGEKSVNAEIVGRLEFTFRAHPHAPIIRAMIEMQEKLLAGKDEIEIPHGLQEALRTMAEERGVSAQKMLITLLLEAMNHLDEKTEIGKELEKRILDIEEQEGSISFSEQPSKADELWFIVLPFIKSHDPDVMDAIMAADLARAAAIAMEKRNSTTAED